MTRVTTGVKDAAGNAMSSQYQMGSAFTTSSAQWVMQAYVKAVNNDVDDLLGYANVSIDGDTLAVGAHQEDSNQTTITNGTSASSNDSTNSAKLTSTMIGPVGRLGAEAEIAAPT